jgi:hypothetical protein
MQEMKKKGAAQKVQTAKPKTKAIMKFRSPTTQKCQ